jgi:hypothetical protein
LKNLQSYLKLVEAKNRCLPGDVASASAHRYDDIFLSGNGRVAEFVSGWILESGIGPTAPEFEDFLSECRMHFPLSCRREVVAAHLSWQNFQAWSKNHSDMKHLDAAIDYLKNLKCELNGIDAIIPILAIFANFRRNNWRPFFAVSMVPEMGSQL